MYRRRQPNPEGVDFKNLRVYLCDYVYVVEYHEDPEILDAFGQVKDMTEAMMVRVAGTAETSIDGDEDGWFVSLHGRIDQIELPEDVDTDKVEQFEEATGCSFEDFIIETINAALADDSHLREDLFYDLFA